MTATEQRDAGLVQGEDLSRSVIEALDGALCIVGVDGTVLGANGRWIEVLRASRKGQPETVGPVLGGVGTSFFAWTAAISSMGDLLETAANLVHEVIDTHDLVGDAPPNMQIAGTDRFVKGKVGPDDARRWVVIRIHPIKDHSLARAVVTMTDITDGMATQEKLHRTTEEAQRLALVARATDSGVAITLPDGTIEWVNDPFVQRTGHSAEDAVGRLRLDLIEGACWDQPEFREFVAAVARGEGADGEFAMVSRLGEAYWANLEVRPVVNHGRVVHLVWVEQDVTARRETQARLSEAVTQSEQFASALTQEKSLLARVISAIPNMVYWKDGEGRYLGCNSAFLAFRGLATEADVLGRTEFEIALGDAMSGEMWTVEPGVIDSGVSVVNKNVELLDSTGESRSLSLSVLPLDHGEGSVRGVLGVGADVSYAREIERQLAQANRLESIGQLAAGIAHEINTPVQYVADNTQFIADSTAELLQAMGHIQSVLAARGSDTDATALLADIAASIKGLDVEFLVEEIPAAVSASKEGLARVGQLVRAMKDYSHPGSGRADTDVNRAIDTTIQVCRNEWKYVADVKLELAEDAGMVPCFEGELKQVILNIIVNAAQAIDEDRKRQGRAEMGTITIATARTADELVITISDDGPGMDEEVKRRVFDPFFTTKDVGKGTGQGLALAHGVMVKKHQGRIDLETSPGHGSTFTLGLPLVPPQSTVEE